MPLKIHFKSLGYSWSHFWEYRQVLSLRSLLEWAVNSLAEKSATRNWDGIEDSVKYESVPGQNKVAF